MRVAGPENQHRHHGELSSREGSPRTTPRGRIGMGTWLSCSFPRQAVSRYIKARPTSLSVFPSLQDKHHSQPHLLHSLAFIYRPTSSSWPAVFSDSWPRPLLRTKWSGLPVLSGSVLTRSAIHARSRLRMPALGIPTASSTAPTMSSATKRTCPVPTKGKRRETPHGMLLD